MNHLKSGFSTNVGRVRSHNEDCFRTEPELGLWLVADGMGGHKGGEMASAIAADFIVEKIKAGKPLEESIAQAHHAIKQASKEGKGPEGMGTTVVALRVENNNYEISWVGDCRAYLWDGTILKQLTKDHSYVQHLIDTGVISHSESENHPYQDVLIQALGAADINDVNVDAVSHEFHQNEQIMMCSDGLTKEITDKGIAEILALELEEQKKVDLLIQTALQNKGRDNITVMLISANADAPVKQPDYATVPIDMVNTLKTTLFEKLSSWLRRIFKVFF